MKIRPSVVVPILGAFTVLTMTILVAVVIGLGGDGDQEANVQASPTPPSIGLTPSPNGSATPLGDGSPTPIPTAPLLASPTPLQFQTSAPPPTRVVQGTDVAQVPIAIGITSPGEGSILRGNVTVLGSASHPDFVQYALEYGPSPNPSNLWYPITSVPITRTVINNALGAWNTFSVPDGNYEIRLHVWLRNGVEDFRVVRNLQVRNAQIQPTAATNNNPLISPIGAISLTQGRAVTIALGMTDIDNDPLTYTVQVVNPLIATVVPSGASAITINGLNQGVTNVTVTVSDGRGGTASTTFAVTVTAPPSTNNPPAISPVAAQSITTGQTLNINVIVTDPDPGDTVQLTAASGNAEVVTAAASGNTITLIGRRQGSASINLTATDSRGLSTVRSFSVSVTDPVATNRPPTIGAVGNQTVTAGESIDVALTVNDPDNDPLIVTANTSNPGIATGLIITAGNTFSVRVTGVSGGQADITLTVDDRRGGVANTSFRVTVNPAPSPNNPPVIQTIPNQSLETGEDVTITVNATDPDPSDTVSISAVVQPPEIASVSLVGTNQLSIRGQSAGSATITVTATDGKDSANTSFTLTVTQSVNNPPVLQPIDNQTCVPGGLPTVSISYSDPDGDPLTVTVASTNPEVANATVDEANSDLLLSCLSAGTASLTVIVNDGKNGTDAKTFTVTVTAPNNPPVLLEIPAQTCEPNTTREGIALNYSDPDGDELQINVSSGNANIAEAVFSPPSSLTLNCKAVGEAVITVVVDDGRGETASRNFTVTVQQGNQPPTLTFTTDVSSLVCNPSDAFSVGISATDPDGDTLTITPSSDNEGFASVSLVSQGELQVVCNAIGVATITVSVEDGQGGSDSGSFVVNVIQGNRPPELAPISPLTCEPGQTQPVTIGHSDPDGDVLTITPSSNNEGVASVTLADLFQLSVTCNAVGEALITVNADDGQGGSDSTSFTVTVQQGNRPPVITFLSSVDNLTCEPTNPLSVSISVTDPDGNTVNVTANSDNAGVVGVNSADSNSIQLVCNAVGNASITVNADDGQGGTDSKSFNVAVQQGNRPPEIARPNDVSCNEGESNIPVSLNISDPDSDAAYYLAPTSDNDSVASASPINANTIGVTCSAAGIANITIRVEDGRGGEASTQFAVNVSAGNQNPVIELIQPQTCFVGESPSVSISHNDPDNDTVNISAFSDNDGVASVNVADAFTLQLSCNAVGNALITVNADDGRGGTATQNFPVTVQQQDIPPTFDLAAVPEYPQFDDNLRSFIRNSANINNNVVSAAGDATVNASGFLTGFGTGNYDIGNTGLQNVVDTFGTSFANPRYAVGDDWSISNLFNPNFAHPDCNGQAPLTCEFSIYSPSVVFISFSLNNAQANSPDDFRANLQQVIGEAIGRGVVPVLVTIPDTSQQAGEYNQVIVEVATNGNMPLWNIYHTLQGANPGVGNGNPFDLSDGALTFEANRRNYGALQLLRLILEAR